MQEEFDTGRAFGHISKLASNGRLYGTPGERLARAYIIASGGEGDVSFKEEEARFSGLLYRGFMPAVILLIAVLGIGGSISYLYNGYAALVLGALLPGVLFIIPFGFKVIDRLSASRGRDMVLNLVGRVESEGNRGAVIICAHYDSKGQFIQLPIRLILLLSSLISVLVLSILFIVSGILSITGRDVSGNAAVSIIGIVVAVVLVLLVLDRPGNQSPGALDNASGVAVILELARILRMDPLQNLDLMAVAFGAEELGLCGSAGYVREHKDELRAKPCYVINFDMPFSRKGKIAVTSGFGFPPKRTSKKLNEFASAAAADMGYKIDMEYMMGGSSDHYHWVKEGFEATSFTSSTWYIHSSRDTVDRINREAIGRVGDIALGMIRKLDNEYS